MFEISDLWEPKFEITPDHAVSTYGSCFAQHIGRALSARGFDWLITEPGPRGLSPDSAKHFNYGVFSSRTGNIYTTSLLRQWVSWAQGTSAVPDEVWQTGSRVYDPFRPAVEPDGFSDSDEMKRTQKATIQAFARSITKADFFVFTLGLTESWISKTRGYEYPMCPGTAAGTFDPEDHVFVNQDYPTVDANLRASLDAMREMNPNLRFILTVSPVPLTATRSDDHVMVATMYSKSVLRAVAGNLAKTLDYVDYFPSYEIINAPPFRGTFFKPNQRSVADHGVDFVMSQFFSGVSGTAAAAAPVPARKTPSLAKRKARDAENEVCEESLLDAFGPKK